MCSLCIDFGSIDVLTSHDYHGFYHVFPLSSAIGKETTVGIWLSLNPVMSINKLRISH